MQVGDGAVNAAFEPALVRGPGGRRRREVERPSRAAFEPSVNIGMFVVVVDDAVDRLFPRNLFFNDIEEVDT
jgi:hypothetical protein